MENDKISQEVIIAIRETAQKMVAQQFVNCQVESLRVGNLEKGVDNNRKLLTGNGEPEKGLITKVDRIESTVYDISKDLKDLSDERKQDKKQEEDDRRWLHRLIIGTVVTNIIILVLGIVLK